MRLSIQKLGRIREAEIELRPLTVLVGPNNTNKSWVAYSAYALLQALAYNGKISPASPPEMMRHPLVDKVQARLTRSLKPLRDETSGVREIEVTERVERSELRRPTDGLERSWGRKDLPPWFGHTESLEEGAEARLWVSHEEAEQGIFTSWELNGRREANAIAFRSLLTTRTPGPPIEARWREEGRRLDRELSLPPQMDLLIRAIFWEVFPFPVERQALLQPALQDPLNQPRDPYQSASRGRETWLSALPRPVIDFLYWTNEARLHAAMQSRRRGDSALASMLGKVLGGKVLVDERRAVQFQVGGHHFALSASASMVRALAGLSLYLEHLARPGDVLVIDEPEMNAHPQAQLALAELFAVMVNRGYRVLFTTHSPYIVEQITNLMCASRVPEDRQEALAEKFQLGTREAFLSPDKVEVREFKEQEDGSVAVIDVLDREQAIIDTSNFGRWSDRLSDLYNEILVATDEQ